MIRTIEPYFLTLLLVVAAALVANSLAHVAAVETTLIFFMPPVLVAAIVWGPLPALCGIALSIFTVWYAFYAPILDLAVEKPVLVFDLVLFAVVAVVVGTIADWARRAARRAERREAMLTRLVESGRELADAGSAEEVARIVAREARAATGAAACVIGGAGGATRVLGGDGEEFPPGAAAAARWRLRDIAAPGTVPRREPVALALAPGAEPDGEEALFLDALTETAAATLDRMALARRLEAMRVDQRADALREAILNSVSHDLRTPLSAILGSATTLERYGGLCSDAERQDLAATIREGAQRLDRFIARMVDLTRIRAGKVEAAIEPADIADVLDVALRHAADRLRGHAVVRDFAAETRLALADSVLLEQAVVNVVENAAKYTPEGKRIRIALASPPDAPDWLEIAVSDEGCGLTAAQRARVFDQFYRAAERRDAPAGSGLGLAIARGFVEACGGTIAAESDGPGRGTTIRIRLRAAPAQRSDIE